MQVGRLLTPGLISLVLGLLSVMYTDQRQMARDITDIRERLEKVEVIGSASNELGK